MPKRSYADLLGQDDRDHVIITKNQKIAESQVVLKIELLRLFASQRLSFYAKRLPNQRFEYLNGYLDCMGFVIDFDDFNPSDFIISKYRHADCEQLYIRPGSFTLFSYLIDIHCIIDRDMWVLNGKLVEQEAWGGKDNKKVAQDILRVNLGNDVLNIVHQYITREWSKELKQLVDVEPEILYTPE